MGKNHSRHRRIGATALLGLTAMLVGLLVAPSVGQAAGTETRVAESFYQQTLTVENPDPDLTLRELQRMAERATGTSISPGDLSVLVDAGGKEPAILLVSLADGPSLDITFREMTDGHATGEAKVEVHIHCSGKCEITVND